MKRHKPELATFSFRASLSFEWLMGVEHLLSSLDGHLAVVPRRFDLRSLPWVADSVGESDGQTARLSTECRPQNGHFRDTRPDRFVRSSFFAMSVKLFTATT